MLVHWVKVIWAKDGGSGTQRGPAIIFSEKKSTSLNPMRLSPKYKYTNTQINKYENTNINYVCEVDGV